MSKLPLFGKSFCLTGALISMTREEASSAIYSRGGRFDASPTYNTTYLVVGEKPGTTKLKAGKSKGCIQINENEFLKMIKNEAIVTSPLTKKEELKPVEPTKPVVPLGLQVRDW